MGHGNNDKINEDCGKAFERIPIVDIKKNINDINYTALADLIELATEFRVKLIDQLCDFDEDLAAVFLEKYDCDYDMVSEENLEAALRNVALFRSGEAVVVCLGSAYKNIGVQPLMDAVVKYLPSPNDRVDQNDLKKIFEKNKLGFCGMVFKIMHPTQQKHIRSKIGDSVSALSFTRVFHGRLNEGDTVYTYRHASNVSKG